MGPPILVRRHRSVQFRSALRYPKPQNLRGFGAGDGTRTRDVRPSKRTRIARRAKQIALLAALAYKVQLRWLNVAPVYA